MSSDMQYDPNTIRFVTYATKTMHPEAALILPMTSDSPGIRYILSRCVGVTIQADVVSVDIGTGVKFGGTLDTYQGSVMECKPSHLVLGLVNDEGNFIREKYTELPVEVHIDWTALACVRIW